MGLEVQHSDKREMRSGDRCPECSSGKLVEDAERGELNCRKCGYVAPIRLEEQIGRAKLGEDGGIINTSGKSSAYGNSSYISTSNKDYSGATIHGEVKSMMNRLRVWDSRAISGGQKQRNLRKMGPELQEWCSILGLNENASNEAMRIYKKALNARLLTGRSSRAIAAASIKIACRLNDITRTDDQIIKTAVLRPKEFRRSYRILVSGLDMAQQINHTVQDPKNFISTAINGLDISRQTLLKAHEILDRAKEKGVADGKSPLTMASFAVYAACLLEGENISQKDLAAAAGTSTVTLRNTFKFLAPKLLIDLSTQAKPQKTKPPATIKPAEVPAPQAKPARPATVRQAEPVSARPRSLSQGLNMVSKLGDTLKLDDKLILDAHKAYEGVYNSGKWNQKNILSMAIASIQAARVANDLPKLDTEELKVLHLSDKHLRRSVSMLKKFNSSTPQLRLQQIANTLGLQEGVSEQALSLLGPTLSLPLQANRSAALATIALHTALSKSNVYVPLAWLAKISNLTYHSFNSVYTTFNPSHDTYKRYGKLPHKISKLIQACQQLGLDERSTFDAIVAYQKAYEMIKGRSRLGPVLYRKCHIAAIQAACMMNNKAPFTPQAMARAGISQKDIANAMALAGELGIMPPRFYLPAMARALGLGSQIERRAGELLDALKPTANSAPMAANALYVAATESGIRLTFLYICSRLGMKTKLLSKSSVRELLGTLRVELPAQHPKPNGKTAYSAHRFLGVRNSDAQLNLGIRKLVKVCKRLGMDAEAARQAASIYISAYDGTAWDHKGKLKIVVASVQAHRILNNLPQFGHKTLTEAGILKTTQDRAMRAIRKFNLITPQMYLGTIALRLHLSGGAEDRASELIRMSQDAKIVVSRDPMAMAAAAVYLSLIERGAPMERRLLASTIGLSHWTLMGASRKMNNGLGLKITHRAVRSTPKPPAMNLQTHLSKMAAALNLSPEIIAKTDGLLKDSQSKGTLKGLGMGTAVSGALYLSILKAGQQTT
ncbi:MAG: hypothetical protein KGH49_03500, partial [Candidatus Micrarchaeota archaeon]|nr:hypothetical protein [Candidatus Micrarchaeota archaeon]